MKREAHEDSMKLLSNKRHNVCGGLCDRGQRCSSCMQRSRVPEKWPRLWVGAVCLMGRSHYTSLSVKIRSECTSQPLTGQPTAHAPSPREGSDMEHCYYPLCQAMGRPTVSEGALT